jgi:hypothetical protein
MHGQKTHGGTDFKRTEGSNVKKKKKKKKKVRDFSIYARQLSDLFYIYHFHNYLTANVFGSKRTKIFKD